MNITSASTGATLQMPETWMKNAVPHCSIVVSKYTVAHEAGEIIFDVNPHDKGICLLYPEHRGEIQVVELFSGLAGRTYALGKMGLEPTVLGDRDFQTAMTCACALNCRLATAREAIDLALQSDRIQVVLHDDIAKTDTWMYLGLLNVSYILAYQGMQSADGKIFVQLLKHCAAAKVRVLVCENLAGITHPDFAGLTKEATMHGYNLSSWTPTGAIQCAPMCLSPCKT